MNGFLIADHFIDQCRLFAARFGLAAEQIISVPGNIPRRKEGERRKDDHRCRDRRGNPHHEKQRDHNGDQTGEKL